MQCKFVANLSNVFEYLHSCSPYVNLQYKKSIKDLKCRLEDSLAIYFKITLFVCEKIYFTVVTFIQLQYTLQQRKSYYIWRVLLKK
jgi:hypothetical protein